MPTKRTDKGKSMKPQRNARASSRGSHGAGLGNSGGSRSSRGQRTLGGANHGAHNLRGTGHGNLSGGSRHSFNSSPSVGQRISGAVGSVAGAVGSVVGGVADAVGSATGKKSTPSGFSTSFQGSQRNSSVPEFTSQGTRSRNPGNVNIEGGNGGGFDPELLLTRRNLLVGAAAVGGIAVVGGGVSFAVDKLTGSDDTTMYISVAEDAVTGTDDLKQVKRSTYCSIDSTHHLPYGTLMWADNDTYACLLVPGEDSSPLNTISCMKLSNGNRTSLVKKAKGNKDGFEIVDARLSTKGLIWTEVNVFENAWRVYTATFDGDSVDNTKKVDEGNEAWITPSIAAVGNRAFWQVVPNSEGESASEPSVVRSATFGSKDYEELITSKRAFATRIAPTSEGVVVTPRAESTGTYYQLTLLDAESGEVTDQMTLPASMTPDQASYGRSGFNFGFTDTYNYGGGIANLGTYTPMTAAEPYNYDNLSKWFRFGRTPSAAPCWCGEWFCVKSTRGISGIHFSSKKYFSISPVSDTDDWGEYLVSTGTCKRIVGLSKITPSDGSDSYTLVRIFTTKDGKLGSAF